MYVRMKHSYMVLETVLVRLITNRVESSFICPENGLTDRQIASEFVESESLVAKQEMKNSALESRLRYT